MRGEIVTLDEPSGSGRPALHEFSGSLDEGEVWIKGQLLGYRSSGRTPRDRDSEASIAEVRRPVAMVFQQFSLWPHMACSTTSPPRSCSRRKCRRDAARKARRRSNAWAWATRPTPGPRASRAASSSVGIARALAIEPEVMLLDEPTSALDPELVEEVLNVIRSLAQDGMTMVMVTHEMSFAAKISDKVVFMEAGAIVEAGPPAQLFGNTRTPRLQQFLKPWLERSWRSPPNPRSPRKEPHRERRMNSRPVSRSTSMPERLLAAVETLASFGARRRRREPPCPER
jgi:polar amino acid transport system ATP-binding protein